MCRNTDIKEAVQGLEGNPSTANGKEMDMPTITKKILFTVASVALGVYAQIHKLHITGPFFDPILEACSDSSYASVTAFAQATGHQPYEAAAGLGAFAPIVCTVTQFMYQLRHLYPEGHLTWGLAVVGVLPLSVICTIEGGRAGAKGPIRYPIVMGIVHQLLGMSVSMPLFWIPAYIWGRGDGPASPWRVYASVPITLPACVFSALVFAVDTNSYLWRLSAGIVGGPALALVSGAILWFDKTPPADSKEAMAAFVQATKNTYRFMTGLSLVCWAALVRLAYTSYGLDVATLWRAICTEADPGVEFLTIDYILIYIGIIFGYVAYRSWSAAIRTALTLPVLGPAAVTIVMQNLEEEASSEKLQKAKVL